MSYPSYPFMNIHVCPCSSITSTLSISPDCSFPPSFRTNVRNLLKQKNPISTNFPKLRFFHYIKLSLSLRFKIGRLFRIKNSSSSNLPKLTGRKDMLQLYKNLLILSSSSSERENRRTQKATLSGSMSAIYNIFPNICVRRTHSSGISVASPCINLQYIAHTKFPVPHDGSNHRRLGSIHMYDGRASKIISTHSDGV